MQLLRVETLTTCPKSNMVEYQRLQLIAQQASGVHLLEFGIQAQFSGSTFTHLHFLGKSYHSYSTALV